MQNDPGLVAALVALGTILLDRGIAWIRNRRKDDAEAGLTIDQRWENYANAQDERIQKLEERIATVEDSLAKERDRSKGLAAEVDRYKRIARSLARHVMRLRDELAKANGSDLPTLPADVEDALTIIDLPN